VVERAVYLGPQRHYIVKLQSGAQLQVLASSDVIAHAGESVGLALPPVHCRALMR